METERNRLDYRRRYRTHGAAKATRNDRFVRRTIIQSIVCIATLLSFYVIGLIDTPVCKDLVHSAKNTLEYTVDLKETAATITDKTKSLIESAVKISSPTPAQEVTTDAGAN